MAIPVIDLVIVGVLVKGRVVAIAVLDIVRDGDLVRVTETVIDLVNGLVVAIAVIDLVTVVVLVKGLVVAIADRLTV